MESGKLMRVYEVTCRKCAKVERLFKTINVSKRHLRSLGWCESSTHDWYCADCKGSMPQKAFVTYPQDHISKLFEFTNEDAS